MKETPKYLVIPHHILSDSDLSATGKMILALMEQFPDMPYTTVGKIAGVSSRQVYNYRKLFTEKLKLVSESPDTK